ncbi:MAG: hypothetical protein HY898_36780 [Deltaproteobacteria bacterium]|nr:hypothetical protein [Deltaproteobacteria bacterium]
MQQPMNYGAQPQAKSGSSVVVIIIVVAVVVVFAIIGGIGVMAAMGIYGTRKYISAAKEAEGKNGVGMIARNALAAADREGDDGKHALPPTAQPVPASLSDVSGRKYMSTSSDWSSPGWKELKFSMTMPQYFQYQWVRTSATEGVARAVSDLDGDGRPDVTFELPVTCTATPDLTCQVAPTIKETR